VNQRPVFLPAASSTNLTMSGVSSGRTQDRAGQDDGPRSEQVDSFRFEKCHALNIHMTSMYVNHGSGVAACKALTDPLSCVHLDAVSRARGGKYMAGRTKRTSP
jgi:hypothetical protein